MGVQRVLVALAVGLFAVAAALAALALRTYLRDDIRGVLDDLSGRRRAAGLACQAPRERHAVPQTRQAPAPGARLVGGHATAGGTGLPEDTPLPEEAVSPQRQHGGTLPAGPGDGDLSAHQPRPAFRVTRRIVLVASDATPPLVGWGAEGDAYRYTEGTHKRG